MDAISSGITDSLKKLNTTSDDSLLGEIENNLAFYEKISLLFLVIDDSSAIQHMLTTAIDLNRRTVNNFTVLLVNWSEQHRNHQIWRWQLYEALYTMQLYQILLKFHKSNSVDYKNVTHLSPFRKSLYLLAENLEPEQTISLVESVRNEFNALHLEFVDYNVEFLEMYFLHWISVGYLNEVNVTKIFEEKLSRIDALDQLSRFKSYENPNLIHRLTSNNNDFKSYVVDCQNPGICLIVNQVHFYTEFDPKFRHLLPSNLSEKLEMREGSAKDRDALVETFTKCGFKIIIKEDLDHLEVIQAISMVVNSIENESSLIVCIMSHGDKGVVYGSNSCQVDVVHIQNTICSQKNWKNLNVPSDLSLDGPSSGQQPVVPITTDMLTFWATLPGFGAIRDKKHGSWFIQSLCGKINALKRTCHFEDICTTIVDDITGKMWRQSVNANCQTNRTVTMVPVKVSTLRKHFYLP